MNIRKTLTFLTLIAALTLLGSCTACSKKTLRDKWLTNGKDITIEDRNKSKHKTIESDETDFFVTITADYKWILSCKSDSNNDWITVNPSKGDIGYTDIKISVDANKTQNKRKALLICSTEANSDTLTIIQNGITSNQNPDPDPIPDPDPDPNPNNKEVITPGAKSDLIEIPKLSGKQGDYFMTHKVDGEVNYSIEYDTKNKHSRWVAFSFDNKNSIVRTKRSNAWGNNPLLSIKLQADPSDFKGYTRGHLVASYDRVSSRAANVQTFYYTNMSPQTKKHNTGVWLQIEQVVQDWGRNSTLRDKMYVVKGGTIREDQILKRNGPHHIPVPKYYFMAILIEKNGKYKGTAFWTEHEVYRVNNLSTITLSIDELERKTGFDFFHNLPDNIENDVEATNCFKMINR